MVRIGSGVFLILHGLVHLLYFGQSRRLFELQAGLTWPDGAWAFSWLGDAGTRWVAGAGCVVAAAGFVTGGVGMLAGQPWSRVVLIATSAVFGLMWLLLWNGRFERLDDQGIFAVLINAAILTMALVIKGSGQ